MSITWTKSKNDSDMLHGTVSINTSTIVAHFSIERHKRTYTLSSKDRDLWADWEWVCFCDSEESAKMAAATTLRTLNRYGNKIWNV